MIRPMGRPFATITRFSRVAVLALVVATPRASPGLPSSPWEPIETTESLTGTEPAALGYLEAINDLRSAQQSPPLRLSKSLSQAARILLDRALLGPVTPGFDAEATLTLEDLQESGYEPNQWAEALASSTREPGDFVAVWRQANPQSLDNFLDPGLRDFGLAAEIRLTQSIFALVAGTSRSETDRPILEALSDLETVRRQLLDRVNEERKRRRRGPLRLSGALNAAAQTYADRMNQEGFYGHVSPRGDTVLDRVQASGYDPELTGENLASGQRTVEQAMDNWMASQGHRDNILEPRFRDLGLGVSVLDSEGELKILWVQCFGTPRP